MAVLIGYTSYNRLQYTQATLPALLSWIERRQADVELMVADDCSTDGSREYLRQLFQDRHPSCPKWTALLLAKNRQGVATCCNMIWRQTDGDYVKFDNDVVILRDDWLDTLQRVAMADPRVGVVAHNCEITLKRPYAEHDLSGARVATPLRPFGTVAGACVFIPGSTRERCGRWNEHEDGQPWARGLDLVYSAKLQLARLLGVYTTGAKDVYVKCLKKREPEGYARERDQMKQQVGDWATAVIQNYRDGRRVLNDVL